MTEIEERTEMKDEDRERTVSDITEAEKYEFLQLIRQGLDRREAASALGYKARPWRALTSPRSPFYDEDFTFAYGDATRSPEYQIHFNERLREEILRRALTDSDRLLEKMGMVHLPEWAVLRQKEVNTNVRVVIQQYFKQLPAERLEQLIAWMDDEGEQAVIDAVAHEIPELSVPVEHAA